MFEWLAQHYLRLIANFKILLDNPTHCLTVDFLQFFTLTLLGVFAMKLALHLLIFQHLKRQYVIYTESESTGLFRIYHRAIGKVNLRRTPEIYRFGDARPLIFTIGSLRPAIFLAPVLVERLPDKELEAVLVHELTHIKRYDNLLIWFLEMLFVAFPLLIIQFFAVNFIFSIENSLYAILVTLWLLLIFKLFAWKLILFLRELSCDDLSVDAIRDPLVLASSLVNVWRCAQKMPIYRWQASLHFTQTLLPDWMRLEYRIQRLAEYRRPWLKFAVAKSLRYAAILAAVLMVIFLWRFYSDSRRPAPSVGKSDTRVTMTTFAANRIIDFVACEHGKAGENQCIIVLRGKVECLDDNDLK